MSSTSIAHVRDLPIDLERDISLLRSLIRELAGTLRDVSGREESAGFIRVIGERIGESLNQSYRLALNTHELDRNQVAEALVDLKRRIQGSFYVIEESDEKIVFGNRNCPFAGRVIGRPAMCMMTSSVFGVIAAENLGQAKVVLNQTIADGAPACQVTVYLRDTEEAAAAKGREYFKSWSMDETVSRVGGQEAKKSRGSAPRIPSAHERGDSVALVASRAGEMAKQDARFAT